MSSSSEYVYMNAVFDLESDPDPSDALESIRMMLEEKFRTTKHKSPSFDADMLAPEFDPKLEDYVLDVRLYNPSPEEFKWSWLADTPAVYLNSESKVLYILVEDLVQLRVTN